MIRSTELISAGMTAAGELDLQGAGECEVTCFVERSIVACGCCAASLKGELAEGIKRSAAVNESVPAFGAMVPVFETGTPTEEVPVPPDLRRVPAFESLNPPRNRRFGAVIGDVEQAPTWFAKVSAVGNPEVAAARLGDRGRVREGHRKNLVCLGPKC